MKEEFSKRGIGLAAISADYPADSTALIEKENITVPLLSDPTLEVISTYGLAMEGDDIAVPSTLIINQNKEIHWKYVGEDMKDRPSAQTVLELAEQAR
jgi:peroxiredoxin